MSRAQPTVLVPVDLSTEERPDPDLLDLFHAVRVVLLGWYPVPDQTALGQLQDQEEEAAIERIEAIAAEFPDEGSQVETLVVFTHDRAETVDRVAEEKDCDVVVVPNETRDVENVLVPIRGDVNLHRIIAVVGAALQDTDVDVTLFHAQPPDDEDPSAATLLLEGAADELATTGVDRDRIDRVNVTTASTVDAILDATTDNDVIVIGESEPSLVDTILGDLPSELIERSSQPVLVVRNVD